MMPTTWKSVAALTMISALCVSACGKNDEDSSSKVTAPSLEGTWKTSCAKNDDGNYAQSSLVVSGSNATLTGVLYGNGEAASTCPDNQRITTIIKKVTLKTGDAASAPADSYKLDLTLTSLNMTTHNGFASFYNGLSVCGITNWTDEAYTDIAGKTCSSTDGSEPTVGAVEYNVYKVDGTKLFLGKDTASSQGVSEATRISELETTPFDKQ